MARSYRKTPILGITAAVSEKDDKRMAHRRWRQAVRQALHRGDEPLPRLREVSDVWGFAKDGKRWWDAQPYLMRK